MCHVTSQGHDTRRRLVEQKGLLSCAAILHQGSNSNSRPMQITQLQSVKFVKVGNRECVETIARVW